MRTIEQIQQKLYEMQEKNKKMESLQRDVLRIQSEIDTLLIDAKYNYQIEQFLTAR